MACDQGDTCMLLALDFDSQLRGVCRRRHSSRTNERFFITLAREKQGAVRRVNDTAHRLGAGQLGPELRGRILWISRSGDYKIDVFIPLF